MSVAGRNERGPGLAGLRLVLDGFARHRRNADQHVALRALDFTSGELLITLKVLLAVRTGKLEFAHRLLDKSYAAGEICASSASIEEMPGHGGYP